MSRFAEAREGLARRQGWRVGVDTGGTFTDLVLCSPAGLVVATHKLASTPGDPSVAVLAGIDGLLERHAAASGLRLGRGDVAVTHGSTVATNALIERRGQGGVVFVTTAGFEDVLFLGRQHRPDLYALVPGDRSASVPVLRSRCVGVAERMGFDGTVLDALTEAEVARLVSEVLAMEPGSVAVSLLHSCVDGSHEARLVSALREALGGAVSVTASVELLPVVREYERAAACVVNAAVGPVMRGYLGRLSEALAGAADGGEGLRVMGSHGGTLSVAEARSEPVRTVLSGPAGGVSGVGALVSDALDSGGDAGGLITLDMGGTSTDVCLVELDGGGAALSTEHVVGVASEDGTGGVGLPLVMPMVDVRAVGAGGGSVAWVDGGGALRVGPRSAGADPGPACYGKQRGAMLAEDGVGVGGWWPTVTDAHVVLGHLGGEGAETLGGLGLVVADAWSAVEALAGRLGVSVATAASGVLAIAEATMARAVQGVSLSRGRDPRGYSLVAFGGAGGLHGCAVAERLGMTRVLVPACPGLLCAAGMLSAPARRTSECSVLVEILRVGTDAEGAGLAARLAEVYGDLLGRCGGEALGLEVRFTVEARYAGQTHALEMDGGVLLRAAASDTGSGVDLREAWLSLFDGLHEARFGFGCPASAVVWTAARVVVDRASRAATYGGAGLLRGDWGVGEAVDGPAVLREATGTTLVPAGWRGRVASGGTLVLERGGAEEAGGGVGRRADGVGIDAIALEVYSQLFSAAAEEMGAALMRCAQSPNITERLDYSCAVFDASGSMIAQAAHIPVHLGSSPASVRAVIDAFGLEAMSCGDRFLLNDPFCGGTHLPDVTVVSPVFLPGVVGPAFFVASRAHHADVGGAEPGSMGLSRSIDEEGVRLGPTRWTERAVSGFAEATRTPAERRADLLAQAAANDAGAARLVALGAEHGVERLRCAGEALLSHAESLTRSALSGLPAGRYAYEDVLDGDGVSSGSIRIACCLEVLEGGRVCFDFYGSDDSCEGPLNAVRSIVESAVLYGLRCFCGGGLPSNSGVLAAVEVRTRRGSVVDAVEPAAVAGGNVETSQRLVDVVFGVLSAAVVEGGGGDVLPADSCGSMNNVVIGSLPGDACPFAYYETLAGGAGGGLDRRGGSGVHTHMTNTRNTPVEVVERRFPLRIERYALRDGSGGCGLYAGGDGVLRSYRFLRAARVTLLLERRVHRPRGRRGGGDGACGGQWLVGLDGARRSLPSKVALDVAAGERLVIETPGGGGFGAVDSG